MMPDSIHLPAKDDFIPGLRKLAAVTLVPITIFMLYIGLRPFDYRTLNDARWLEDGAGIRFSGRGMAIGGTENALVSKNLNGESGITIEIMLKPSAMLSHHLPDILSLTDAHWKEKFSLRQWKDFIVLQRADVIGIFPSSTNVLDSSGVLNPSKITMLTITSSDDQTTLYADAKPVRQTTRFSLASAMSNAPITHLILGNSPAANNGWKGAILGFSILNRELKPEEIFQRFHYWKDGIASNLLTNGSILLYLFREGKGLTGTNSASTPGWDFFISPELKPLKREILALPAIGVLKRRFFYVDAVINFAGFIPFGFLMSLALSDGLGSNRKKLIFVGTISSAILSLTIEFNQVFLLSRDSSLTDLILNSSGGMLGALLLYMFLVRVSHLTVNDR